MFHIFTMSPDEYPGDDAVAETATNTCGARLRDYAGDFPRASLDYSYFLPDQLAWDSGDRSVICELSRLDWWKLVGTTRAWR